MTTLVLIAKEPIPGRVKTRLHPPLTLEQAAELAAASIADTIHAVRGMDIERRILLYEGIVPPQGSEQYVVTPQTTGTLDQRLGAIFDQTAGPTVLIGMDTPQLKASDLAAAIAPWPSGIDAWFGPSTDGGFWALGLNAPSGDLIRGVPMSRDDTGAIQLQRLEDAGLTVGMLPTLTDVDTFQNALDVAAMNPTSRFATALDSMRHETGVHS